MSKAVNTSFLKIYREFEKLSVREQVLLLLCGSGVVVFVFYMLLIQPQSEATEKTLQQIERKSKDLNTIAAQMAELTDGLAIDPNFAAQTRLADIQRALLQTDEALAQQTANLVPATKMPQVLESVLSNSKKLRLLSLQSIAPVALNASQSDAENSQLVLYRHGVKLVLSGSFFEIQGYLQAIESLPWQFYWKKFDYQVEQHPNAKIELELYTLSTNKAFIGV
ncbi:MAG: type II secretion system protein M [Paraglaciecola sp.]|nr:type II secretion system protein M [Paraglaciecola sp.]